MLVGGECECEGECPDSPSSPPRTRNVFSMTKKAAKPTNMPRLSRHKVSIVQPRPGDVYERRTYPIKILRFSSDHDEVYAWVLALAHKCMRDEVQKIHPKATRLSEEIGPSLSKCIEVL